MDFEEFKNKIVGMLCDFYGNDAILKVVRQLKNNGETYTGICISFSKDEQVLPTIYLENSYVAYLNGKSIDECVKAIVELREQYKKNEMIDEFVENLKDWNKIKNHVYPALINTEANKNLLDRLVHKPYLDLSIIYMIRGLETEDGCGNVKITKELLNYYKINHGELYEQAMKNLENDDYCFKDMNEIFQMVMQGDKENISDGFDELPKGTMLVLTNKKKIWGASGMLNEKFLKRKLGHMSYYILPSSIHELIFIPYIEGQCSEEFSQMVQEVNESQVNVEERLSNHVYLYDGISGSIKMCA